MMSHSLLLADSIKSAAVQRLKQAIKGAKLEQTLLAEYAVYYSKHEDEVLRAFGELVDLTATPDVEAFVKSILKGGVKEFVGSGNEGIKGQKYAIMRRALCERIFKQELAQRGFVVVMAPPESGKTGLLQCMARYLDEDHVPNVYVKCSDLQLPDGGIEFDSQLPQLLSGRNLQQILRAKEHLVLLVDEAQMIWDEDQSNSHAFWNALKSLDQDGPTMRVILAAAYGTKRSQAGDTGSRRSSSSSLASPPGIVKQGYAIYVHRGRDDCGLAFTWEEWLEVCSLFEQDNPHLRFAPIVKRYIYESSGGQVGLVMASLDYLFKELRNALTEPTTLTRNAMFKLTSDRFLKRMDFVRSLLRYENASGKPGAAAVLATLFYADYVMLDSFTTEEQTAARKLHVTGMVVIDDEGRVRFTSPIHRIWYFHKHQTERPAHNADTSLQTLLRSVFGRMDPALLKRTDSVGTDGSPLESCWEAEAYRVCVTATPKGTTVSTQAGQAMGAHGPVDVYISYPYCTALEFVRNGDRLTEHLGRFRQGGKYWPLVESKFYKQYAVVDIRKPGSQPPKTQDDILYTVLMSHDWEHADLWHMGKCLTPKPLVLSGDGGAASKQALELAVKRVEDSEMIEG